MYWRTEYRAGRTIEVHKGFSSNVGKRFTRGEGEGCTPDAMAKYNDQVSRWTLTRLLNANFGPHDAHVVLHYAKGSRPDPDTAAKQLAAAKRRLRDIMRTQHAEDPAKPLLQYVSATAIGERGGIHHHLVANTQDAGVLAKAWPYGYVKVTPLYPDGNYAKLANYFCGQNKGEPGGALVIHGNRWSASQGLKRPEPRRERVKANSWREPPKAPAGCYLDPDSIDMGVNPVTGVPYLRFVAVEIPHPRTQAECQRLDEEIARAAQRLAERLPELRANKLRGEGGAAGQNIQNRQRKIK